MEKLTRTDEANENGRRFEQAIIYARYSPRPTRSIKESLQKQVARCRQWCDQKGYRVIDVYTDAAYKGNDETRPGFWDAYYALKPGVVLVAYCQDRLSRSVYLSEVIRRQAAKKGCRIEFVEGSNRINTPEGVLIAQVLDAFAEYQRKVIAARIKAAMRRRQLQSLRTSGTPPYGWANDPDNPRGLIENPKEQAIIKEIARLSQEGYGTQRIKRWLEHNGIRFRGKPRWVRGTIANILRREREREQLERGGS